MAMAADIFDAAPVAQVNTLEETRAMANALARKGLRVFPVRLFGEAYRDKLGQERIADGKEPRTFAWQHTNATTAADVATMFTKASNVGVACGDCDAGRIVVVDIDGARGQAFIDSRGVLPPTLEAATGRDGGIAEPHRHHFYLWPESVDLPSSHALKTGEVDADGRAVAAHVDIKGQGGYVVGVGSTHANGKKYKWAREVPPVPAPSWLVDLVKQHRHRERATAPRVRELSDYEIDQKRLQSWGRAALTGIVSQLRLASDGGKHDALCTASYKAGQLIGHAVTHAEAEGAIAEVIAEWGARVKDAAGALATMDSGFKSGAEKPRHPDERDLPSRAQIRLSMTPKSEDEIAQLLANVDGDWSGVDAVAPAANGDRRSREDDDDEGAKGSMFGPSFDHYVVGFDAASKAAPLRVVAEVDGDAGDAAGDDVAARDERVRAAYAPRADFEGKGIVGIVTGGARGVAVAARESSAVVFEDGRHVMGEVSDGPEGTLAREVRDVREVAAPRQARAAVDLNSAEGKIERRRRLVANIERDVKHQAIVLDKIEAIGSEVAHYVRWLRNELIPQPHLSALALVSIGQMWAGRRVITRKGMLVGGIQIGVAPSGSGKSPALAIFDQCALTPFGIAPANFPSVQALHKALNDATNIMSHGICFRSAELGKVLSALTSQGVSGFRSEITDATLALMPMPFSGVYSYQRSIKDGNGAIEKIVAPAMSIYGTTTATALKSMLTSDGSEDGLLGRCLILPGVDGYDPSRVGGSLFRPMPAECAALLERAREAQAAWSGLPSAGAMIPVGLALPYDPKPPHYTVEAAAMLDAAMTEYAWRALEAGEGPERTALRRCQEQVEKICVCLAVMDCPEAPTVGIEAVVAAIEIAERSVVFAGSLQRSAVAELELQGTPHGRAMRAIERFMMAVPGWHSTSDIGRAVRAHPAEIRAKALFDLLDHGRVELQEVDTSGRKARAWRWVEDGA